MLVIPSPADVVDRRKDIVAAPRSGGNPERVTPTSPVRRLYAAVRLASHHRVTFAFSVYPAGRAGIGLLLLRAAAFATIIGFRPVFPGGSAAFWVVMATLAPLLIAGFMTRSVATLCLGLPVAIVIRTADCSPLLLLSHALAAAALVLLGPGAWSLDARLFGRKRIAIARQGTQAE